MYRLNEEQTAVIEDVRRVADESIAPHAADVDAQGRFPREAVDALAQAGLLGLTIPSSMAEWDRVYASLVRRWMRSPRGAPPRR
jgi:alkylation response protein AidB-like acyl-CoA dehydrogenase